MEQLEKAEVHVRVAEEPSPVEHVEQAEIIRFPEPLILLAKRKSFILKFVGIAAILSVTIVLLLPNTYTAKTKIMPPQQNQSMGAMAALSQLGPLAALAGQGMSLRNPSDIYVALLRSDTVANALIDRFSLTTVYKEKLRIDARRRLEDRSEIIAGKEGVISISVDDRSPQRAADLANSYVEELEKLTKTLNITEAGKRRLFFEHEVKMENDDLANAEVALKQTQEKTGLILLDSQSRAMIESVTSLRAGIAAQEVRVQAMRSFATPENPDLVLAEEELVTMRAQLDRLERGRGKRSIADVPIENVPTAGLEYVRKLRDVKYHEALFTLLAKQYEAAKIDEARDTLFVQQMDKAFPPEKKSGPLRALIVLSISFLAFLVAILIAYSIESLERANEHAQFAARFQMFKFYLRRERKP
ncbi:MAG TPA: Wzz/FepE/Etk N-terminal domain-containing protein [Candidatus Angelobacter sp.]|jgi:tyrosine-protein kinase Etk/Wzc|nr:Wzz/FepE/Etk N-terminal domain-containing protein [Candidatus Angelobacter sp.]